MKKHRAHSPIWYFAPIVCMIPILAVAAYAIVRYGSKISDLLQIALKMVVIQ